MEMRLVGCGMRGLAILISNICSNYIKKSLVEGLSVIKATTGICKGCVIGKHPEHKFDRGKENQATCILGLIHFDIRGMMPVTSMNG